MFIFIFIYFRKLKLLLAWEIIDLKSTNDFERRYVFKIEIEFLIENLDKSSQAPPTNFLKLWPSPTGKRFTL